MRECARKCLQLVGRAMDLAEGGADLEADSNQEALREPSESDGEMARRIDEYKDRCMTVVRDCARTRQEWESVCEHELLLTAVAEPVQVGTSCFPNAHRAAVEIASAIGKRGEALSAVQPDRRVTHPSVPNWLFHHRMALRTIVGNMAVVEFLGTAIEQECARAAKPLLVTLPGSSDVGTQSSSDTGQSPESVAESTSGRVLVFGQDQPPTVDGRPKSTMTRAQYDVILALLQAGEAGLTKTQLTTNSKHGGALGVLKTLAQSDPDWNTVISFPRTTGKRYRVL